MRHIFFILFIAVGLLSSSVQTSAQAPDGSRRYPQRKTVALVLSGGGAKGMGHVGALKVIERAGIPIDIVVGTSMGSIAGGLYSIGYTPEMLDSIVRNQNWGMLLTDQRERKQQSMSGRKREQTFLLSMPLDSNIEKNITGGLVKGQHISNLFSELTMGYHDSIDFRSLPIPFACVSQDMVNGKEVRFYSGRLSQAMRASMAIPGVFTPVRIDSMVLVDGGMINNYPVDVAREMGADIVIGVDVQSKLKSADKLSGTMDMLGQMIDLMGQERYEKNLKQTDLHIKVNVDGYSSASFSRNAIDTLIRRGEEAAMEKYQDLIDLKAKIGVPSDFQPAPRKAYDIAAEATYRIDNIVFEGSNESDKKMLLRRCNISENSTMSKADIKQAIAILTSNLEYSSATYSLNDNEQGGYNLTFTLSKKYDTRLNLGLRFDSEENASLLLNVNTTFRQPMPSTLELTARLGKRYAARLDYKLELSPLQYVGAAYQFEYNDIDFTMHDDNSYNSTSRYHRAELSYSNVWYRNVRYAIGASWELYNYKETLYSEDAQQRYDISNEHFFSYFAQLEYESYDHAYFPRRGISAQLGYTLYTDNMAEYKGHTPISAFRGHLGTVIPLTRRFAILPDIYGRILVGNNIPFAKANSIGGDIPGRYLSQQLPFAGINGVMMVNNALLVSSLKLRQRMGSIHYLTLSGSYALNAAEWDELLKDNTFFGCGITYGMDSMFGPLEATVNWNNQTKDLGFYINLGYKF